MHRKQMRRVRRRTVNNAPGELGDLNDDQVVFEDPLKRPFPKFHELDELLPRISEFVRENDPKYWAEMQDHADSSNEA